jgi:hypothetical protein
MNPLRRMDVLINNAGIGMRTVSPKFLTGANRLLVSNIHRGSLTLAWERLKLREGLVDPVSVSVPSRHEYPRTFGHQGLRHREPQSARRTGNEYAPVTNS